MKNVFYWDGEEGFGYAEVWKNNGWKMLESKVLENNEINLKTSIEKLGEELKEYME